MSIANSPQLERLEQFERDVQNARRELLAHPIYGALTDLAALRIFMKHHVFAVWDFMSLLKSLQRRLTCVDVPWRPVENPRVARFINELVLAEESDELGHGAAAVQLSHFELYLAAMREVGADTSAILLLLASLERGPVDFSAERARGAVWAFMATTFEIAALAPHETAAAFLFGREDVIPEMFEKILARLPATESASYVCFQRYLERHIEVDGQSHGPLARLMLAELCGDDELKWAQATRAALSSIEARVSLWTSIAAELRAARVTVSAASAAHPQL